LDTRAVSYGEHRRFRGLEQFATNRRLAFAIRAIEDLKSQGVSPVSLLDIGCGYNAATLRAMQARFSGIQAFHGVDIRIASEVRRLPGFSIFETNLEAWRPSRTYDVVLSLAVAEHLVCPGDHFRLITSCLSPKGIAVLTTPSPPAHFVLSALTLLGLFDKAACGDHKSYLTDFGIRTHAKAAGLEVLSSKTHQFGLNQAYLFARSEK
jgi:trans-aconitate methyltransferase